MKFGLYSSIANPPRGEQLDRCIDEVIAEAQLAESSGFDSCFFGEHHQDHDGWPPRWPPAPRGYASAPR
jgi:alkanesulfonate monooxygenase SsuD/methylene tetrahydromethanopterin reductase-like flavin-dependent oxidoreductase (luciferase family)